MTAAAAREFRLALAIGLGDKAAAGTGLRRVGQIHIGKGDVIWGTF